MYRAIAVLLALCLPVAANAMNVFACEPEWAALVEELAGGVEDGFGGHRGEKLGSKLPSCQGQKPLQSAHLPSIVPIHPNEAYESNSQHPDQDVMAYQIRVNNQCDTDKLWFVQIEPSSIDESPPANRAEDQASQQVVRIEIEHGWMEPITG